MGVVTNGSVRVQTNGSPQPAEQMTTTDNIMFSATFSPWSRMAADEYKIQPWGVETGGVITPAVSGSNDVIDVSAISLVMPGSTAADADGYVAVGAQTDVAVSRPVGNDYQINAVTVNTSGNVVVVAGTAGTSFSTTRGGSGGPPLIPVDSVEIGHIYYMSQASAAVLASEIRQIPAESQELTGQPVIAEEKPLKGYIKFAEALPNIHTGDVPKQVWFTGALAITAEVKHARNFVPPDTTYTSNSEDFYDAALAAVTRDIQQGTFEAALDNGVSDWIIALAGENVVVEFYPDKLKTPHILCQGIIAQTRDFPTDGQILGSFTLSATEPPENIVS